MYLSKKIENVRHVLHIFARIIPVPHFLSPYAPHFYHDDGSVCYRAVLIFFCVCKKREQT